MGYFWKGVIQMSALLTINGVEVANPAKLEVGRQNINNEDAGRTQTGLMEMEIIVTKTKLNCSWNTLTWEETSKLLQAVEQKKYMTIRYPDPKARTYKTKTFYVGDRTIPAVHMVDGIEKWSNITMNFIER